MRVVGGTGRGRSTFVRGCWVRALTPVLALSAVLAGCGPTPSGSASSSPTGSTTASPTPSASATQPHGIFLPTGNMNALRGGYPELPLLARLKDGRVLVVGGDYTGTEIDAPATGETYDPTTGTWTKAGSLGGAMDCRTATALLDGRVLVAGCFLGGAEVNYLYDPGVGAFSRTGSLHYPRKAFTATLLNDGKVLIVGGAVSGTAWVPSAELYDPATGKFTVTGSLHTPRINHTTTLLADGRVLVAGGDQGILRGGAAYEPTAEVYDPATGVFSSAGNLITARSMHTATLLSDGHVLIAGGVKGGDWAAPAFAEVFDPQTGLFRTVGAMLDPRYGQAAVLLQDGRALILGGESNDYAIGGLSRAELYEPSTGGFSRTGSLIEEMGGLAATLLNDGRVLVVDPGNGAELYWP